jgi:ferric-dicitrate binding protein FerR (iron transport regulator)
MISEIDNLLLIKYLRNELSEGEYARVLSWLEENEENPEFLFGLKETYQLSKWEELKQQSEVSLSWEMMKDKIQQNAPTGKQNIIVKWLQYSAAAVILFILGFFIKGSFFVDESTFNTIQTSAGQQSTLILNDGTKVQLNENSKLIYPSAFNHKNRDVMLTGEAYFEVSHNPSRPFNVNIGTYTIKVLGTKFNVDAYSDQVYIYTSLKEGKIQIVENKDDSKILSELKPGTRFSYNRRTGEYFVNAVDPVNVAQWTRGEIVIKRQTLDEMAHRLEDKYGYRINIASKDIGKYTYNITIENESLEEILSNIHFITPQVNYTIDNSSKTVIIR